MEVADSGDGGCGGGGCGGGGCDDGRLSPIVAAGAGCYSRSQTAKDDTNTMTDIPSAAPGTDKNAAEPVDHLYCAQLQALFERSRTSAPLAFIPIVLTGALHYGRVPARLLFMWLLLMSGIYAVRIAVAAGYLGRPRSGNASPLWLDIQTMAAAATGGGWAAMMFLLDTGQFDLLYALKLTFIAAVAAFMINTLAVIRFVYLAFLLPMLAGLVGHTLMETPFLDPAGRNAILASATAFAVLLAIMSSAVSRLSNESLVQRLAFSDLAHRLERTLAAEQEAREKVEQQARQLEATHLRQHIYATHDPLTRLYNRHRISEVLVRELHLQRRYRIPVAAMAVEIDGFGAFCAEFGPARGDELLVAFATFLAAELREIDYVGRWSGEKFCCVLSRTDGGEALECAERVRQRTLARSFLDGLPEGALTATFGVSPAVDGDDPERLLARADTALYRARQRGTNCCERLDADADRPL